jgi:hypothetical protein
MVDSETSFYVTGGTLRHDAPSYAERQADRDLFQSLGRGEFCYVLTSRRIGKSSLMVHTAAKLRDEGVQVAILDLTAIGQNLSPDQWPDSGACASDPDAEVDGFLPIRYNSQRCTALYNIGQRESPNERASLLYPFRGGTGPGGSL